MGLDLGELLNIRLYQAFDIDSAGRVLAGSDDTGSTQLIEIDPAGTVTALTALPAACSGRYIPGQRAVVVSHDADGDERLQLSLLRLPRPDNEPAGPDGLEPIVHDPACLHRLADVTGGQICYFTNRRNGGAFDPVIRQLADGSERELALGDSSFGEAVLSPDGRWMALTVGSQVTANSESVVLVDLTAAPGEERPVEVTPADAPAMNLALAWAPGSEALYFSSNYDREFTGLARYDLAAGAISWLLTDDACDLTGWLAPDGSVMLVERNEDGRSALALPDAGTGAHRQ